VIIERQDQVTEAVVDEMHRIENPRFREVLESMVRHLHAFARDVNLTEEEFDAAINYVTALGHRTTDSHNETRLMAGSLGLSTLVCLLNNGDNGQTETSANLLGPFWRDGAPLTPNGGSILRSDTPGEPLFFTGHVVDESGAPVVGAQVDVWHASPVGLYENQDPDQAEMNLRGRFHTDENGVFAYRSIKPAGYPVPMGGPVGELLTVEKRHPFRPAHLHSLIYKDGFKTMASQLYSSDDPNLETDAQFGVTKALIAHYRLHENEPAPDPGVSGPWYSLEHRFVLERGKARLPPPPVSGKARKVEAV
jgi:catechol 1,2-dioxygenase